MSKIGISISDRALEYLDKTTKNRSAFIEALVEAQRKKDFQKELEEDLTISSRVNQLLILSYIKKFNNIAD